MSGLEPVGALEDSLQLLERFRSDGDPNALNALFARYYERVRRIAFIRSGPRILRWLEHDDLVQNTFAAALRGIDELDLRDHSSIIGYLSRVLENQIRGAVDHFEAQKRTPASGEVASVERGSDELSRLDPPANDPSPADQAASRELKELYDECVRDLDPAHREIVLLREYTEASWEEIRAALNRPNEHAAQQLYARAQIKLAAKFRQRIGR